MISFKTLPTAFRQGTMSRVNVPPGTYDSVPLPLRPSPHPLHVIVKTWRKPYTTSFIPDDPDLISRLRNPSSIDDYILILFSNVIGHL